MFRWLINFFRTRFSCDFKNSDYVKLYEEHRASIKTQRNSVKTNLGEVFVYENKTGRNSRKFTI